jgi:hypothetical protein
MTFEVGKTNAVLEVGKIDPSFGPGKRDMAST